MSRLHLPALALIAQGAILALGLASCLSSGSKVKQQPQGYAPTSAMVDAGPAPVAGSREFQLTRAKGGGVALLMEGARQGDESLVRTQLASGVRVNAVDRNGETALAHAVRHERHGVSLLLIGQGANVNIRDAQGNAPLHRLCLGPSYYPMQRDASEAGGYSLNPSFYRDRRRVFQAVLAAGADVNMRDAEGVTPLMRALWGSWEPSVEVLVVDAGADPGFIEARTFSAEDARRAPGLAAQSINVSPRAKCGVVDTSSSLSETAVAGGHYEPLRFTAVFRTDDDMVDMLLDAGADPDARNARDCKVPMGPPGATPLGVAAAVGDYASAKRLIRARADVNARDAEGRTPLMHAAIRGDGSMARLFLSAGADRSLRDNSGLSAAQHAAARGFSSLAAMLENPSAYRRFVNAIGSIFD